MGRRWSIANVLSNRLRRTPDAVPNAAARLGDLQSIEFFSTIGSANRSIPSPNPAAAPFVSGYALGDVLTGPDQERFVPNLDLVLPRFPISNTDGSRGEVWVGQYFNRISSGQILPMLGRNISGR